MNGEDLLHGSVQVVVHGRLAVQHLHGECSSGYAEDGRAAEVDGEAVGVHGGRGDDELEVPAPHEDLPHEAEQHIGVERALVRLVHDDAAVGVEVLAGQRLAQQHALRHVLDQRRVRRHVLEADVVPHLGAQRTAELLAHALGHGHGGHAPRLSATDDAQRSVPLLVQILRQLGRLPTPRTHPQRATASDTVISGAYGGG